jgi:hypothetical protein
MQRTNEPMADRALTNEQQLLLLARILALLDAFFDQRRGTPAYRAGLLLAHGGTASLEMPSCLAPSPLS